jgi:hypothetical protein
MNSRSRDVIARATAERDALLRECHQLLEQISRRPGAIKLLTGAKSAFEMYAQYKANREQERVSG